MSCVKKVFDCAAIFVESCRFACFNRRLMMRKSFQEDHQSNRKWSIFVSLEEEFIGYSVVFGVYEV